MVKRHRVFGKIFEVLFVGSTVITHWLVFYFILINSFKIKRRLPG